MKAGCNTWREALHYHGVLTDDNIEDLQVHLLSYMITSLRYSVDDIVRISSPFKFDVCSVLRDLQSTLPVSFHPLLCEVISAATDYYSLQQSLTAPVSNSSAVDEDVTNHFIRYTFTPEQIQESKDWLESNTDRLNVDQSSVFRHVTSRILSRRLLETNCFVMGKAGTGKSFLISALCHYFTVNRIPHVICASTGIAAMLIHGRTVHSTFNLSVNLGDESVFCNLHLNRPVGVAISRVSVIIIDEVTMLSSKCFDALDRGLRHLMAEANSPNFSRPFGGKSLLLFGDLAQVPAVVKSSDDYIVYLAQFTNASNFSEFRSFHLSISMRADNGDHNFLAVLADVRDPVDGKLQESTLSLLHDLFIPNSEDSFETLRAFLDFDHCLSMVVAFKNSRCHDFNASMLDHLTNGQPAVSCQARFYVRGSRSYLARSPADISEENSRQSVTSAQRPAYPNEIAYFRRALHSGRCSCLTPADLHLAIGARVMLLKNISSDDGLINGAIGRVSAFELDPDQNLISISVHFFHLRVLRI